MMPRKEPTPYRFGSRLWPSLWLFLGLCLAASAQNLPANLASSYSASTLTNCASVAPQPTGCEPATLSSGANVTLLGASEIVLGPGFTAVARSSTSLIAAIGTPTYIATNPSGLSVTVDGSACTAPCVFVWAPATVHTIAATTPLAGAAGTHASWSDGGAQSHSITVPSSAATYTASFGTQYYLATTPGPGGSISSAGWYNSGAVVAVSATANSTYQFTGFTGALTGTATPQSLTMNGPESVAANFSTTSPTVTVTSAPSGLSITVDGSTCAAPCVFNWTPGSTHSVGTTTPQAPLTGTQYVFASWTDGLAQSHSITAPAAQYPAALATYTANFSTQYYLTTSTVPALAAASLAAVGRTAGRWFRWARPPPADTNFRASRAHCRGPPRLRASQ
jgi:hypothetical protein